MKFNVKRCGKNLAILLLSLVAIASVVICVLALSGTFTPKKEVASLILYEGPKPVPASETAQMKVDGHDLFVYDTAVNNTHKWVNN